ncbi:MAG: SDR family NAD(P)-dependent oxidoreductase [Acidobacteria bacterium]|nr:SDR family NAD(P)-dependent oxidoreductase [Acidobacteriota bacterium]
MSAERRGWALVTGASAGIGAEVALRLARRGHPLVIVARRGDRLAALAEQARREHGVEVRGVAADLSREEGRVAVRGVLDQLRGPLEVAVLNAGIGTQGRFVDLDRAAEVREVRLNCVAVVDLASHVLPGMVANGRGDLVVMSSAAASQAIPYMSTYAATKAFEMRFVRGIDQELRGTGVRAFAICPGPVRTAFHRLGWGKDLPRLMPTESAGSVAARVIRVLDRRRRNPVVASGPLAPFTIPLTGLLGEAFSAWGAGLYHRPRH